MCFMVTSKRLVKFAKKNMRHADRCLDRIEDFVSGHSFAEKDLIFVQEFQHTARLYRGQMKIHRVPFFNSQDVYNIRECYRHIRNMAIQD